MEAGVGRRAEMTDDAAPPPPGFGEPSDAFRLLVDGLPSLAGKTLAVTGSTTGTGFVLAREAARKGARVLMLNRPSTRSEAAVERLTPKGARAGGGVFTAPAASPKASKASAQLADETGGSVEHVDCDLTSLASCEAAAASVLRRVGAAGLDVLCCNAAVMHHADLVTADGFDVQMQTNMLGHHVLVCRLWPALAAAAERRGEARVVMHSSAARYMDGRGSGMFFLPRWCRKLQPESFERHADGELGGEGWPVPGKALLFHGPKQSRYQQSKLANFVYAYALRDRCASAGSKVKALVAHPGICQTQLFANGPKKHGYSGIRVGELFFPIFMMSLDDGAQAIIRCCCDGEVASGDFFGPGQPMWPLTFWGAAERQEPERWLITQDQKDLVVAKCAEATGVALDIS